MVSSSDTVDAVNGACEAAVSEADYYLWQVPGKPIEVRLRFDVVDRMSLQVMRGFGAVPRRGAEIGGILLGRVETGDVSTVYVDDFEVIQCEYRHGPTYQLSEGDLARFDEALARWKPETNQALCPIGFYRSTTKESLALTEDDLALFDSRFPAASDLILMVKPYATQVSAGGFFFREPGFMQTASTCLEFPFRRNDLGGGFAERPSRRSRDEALAGLPDETSMVQEMPFSTKDGNREEPGAPEPIRMAPRKGNLWIPLSFIFLLLGVLLGFQAAIATSFHVTQGLSSPYSLGLRLTRIGPNIHVLWDRSSPAIRAARRGVLSITDGAISKKVDLDAATLQTGSVIYRHVTDGLGFKLEAYPLENSSLSESIQVTANRIPAEMPAQPEQR